MWNTGTYVKIVMVGVIAVLSILTGRIIITLGVFSHYYQHYPGPCRRVEGIQPGSENFQTLPNGLTFITSGFRLQKMSSSVDKHFQEKNVKGRIYLFDFNKSESGVKELRIASTATFNADNFYPHGISVWEDKKSGRHTVFAVNHPKKELIADSIEKFEYDPEKQELIHQQTYQSQEAMRVVNDVQATGTNSFYFTNYQYFPGHPGDLMEILFELTWTNVVYFDGETYRVVAGDMKSPNGIAMSNDHKYIYIAPCLGQEIRVFKRNTDNSLELQQVFPLHTIPDNVAVDPVTGDLYTGCHPLGWKILLHLAEPEKLSPSQVLHLHVKDGNITSAQELLYDDGSLITASTSAMVYNRKLLVGSVFHNLIICDVHVPI
ncbi:serum paraoxonase/arylesterase 2-like isoform X1 [Pomacea canaliculata]|uniref:serum paraoxonase/arylesterase 2-like isoform X1 n=2 Tax=Pomacea canaliculata TaxID=400727 RepID=UPI000D726788|nr:serum paraoxonase/arylesterase 2-like isoform X1 [Pomacea canaliculata]XP_025081773.1 serum paraoxonase/arylesterase 2-like isoform X1 [Pomacea canaliculata]XP_025081774.1 serum paraoxonase/arylesterase 2-like isoform X1 [Pomacea canaliculata]